MSATTSDGKRVEELRERFTYATTEWTDIRAEGRIDMRYIAGDPWDPSERALRDEAMRPVLSMDELGQYVNQLNNDVRQNKRGIKVSPVGFGANDKTAAYRQGRIRDIEYKSNAQQAYTTMFENACQRSYGYLAIRARYLHEARGFDQEPYIDPILNPDMVTPDPDNKRTDGTDWKYLFYNESRTTAEFVREFPKAEKRSFAVGDQALAPGWFDGKRILLSEYWAKELAGTRTLYLVKPSARSATNPNPQPVEVFKDVLGAVATDQILKSREVEDFAVTQYLTNGFEILKTTPWPGKSIPFVACYGKVLMVDDGSGSKKKILSLIRLARDPQMMLAYLASCEAELVGMTPKFPYFYYEGQLTPEMLLLLAKSLHVPVAGIAVKAVINEVGQNVLPFPQRQPYEPPIQALELLREAVRRSIQAAIGTSFMPTSAQRKNEKSGKALQQIESSAQKGSFHFVDHYDEAITRVGAILNELIPVYDDTAKEVSTRKPDDSVEMVTINTPSGPGGAWAPQDVRPDQGQHDVTISVGPALESERDAASDFADTLVGNPEIAQVIGPQKMGNLLALAIKLKNVGPLGDEMADIIHPKDQGDPKQAAQQLAQAKQMVDQLHGELQQASEIIKTDKIKADAAKELKAMDLEFQKWKAELDAETKIAVAELGAKIERLTLFLEERARLSGRVQEEQERQHEAALTTLAHQQALEAGQQAQDHALEQGDQSAAAQADLAAQGHQQTLEQGQQAADLAPSPEAGP